MQSPNSISSSRKPRWLWAVLGVAAVSLLVWIVILLIQWPYSKRMVTSGLEEGFDSNIQVASYHLVFLPAPGFVAKGVVFHRHGFENAPPLATIAQIDATGSYATLLFAPRRFQSMRLTGLHVQIPPAGAGSPNASAQNVKQNPGSSAVVERLTADNSQLDIAAKPGEQPLYFDIHRLRLDGVSTTRAFSFSTDLIEPEMQGELHASGKLGPIDTSDPGKTRLAVQYKLVAAHLDQFHGLSGTLASSGHFDGPLDRISVDGTIDTPDFRVTDGHPIHLVTTYKAVVNGIDGDISLDPVSASFDKTTIHSDGDIAGQPKLTSINLSVDRGRIQDLLLIFVREAPPLTGTISLKAKAVFPSTSEPFLKRLRLNGDFGIGGSRFTKPATRQTVDAFSERASEQHPPKDDPNPPPVITDLKGHVALVNGVATLTHISFSLPGASADLSGTYNLLDKHVHLAGNMHMQNDVSHATTGIKSMLLKPLVPFFKKKNKTSVIPIQITGTYTHPIIGPSVSAIMQ